MIRIIQQKYAYQSFRQIFGLNKQTIRKILGILGLKQNASGINLERKFIINKIKQISLEMRLEFKLRLIIFSRIILLIYTGKYRGMRHIQGLPTKGQRTHANGKTPKSLKALGKNIPFRFKRKSVAESSIKNPKKLGKPKKKTKLSKKQKGKLKAKQKTLKKKK